jgi:hypothetical protein
MAWGFISLADLFACGQDKLFYTAGYEDVNGLMKNGAKSVTRKENRRVSRGEDFRGIIKYRQDIFYPVQ